MIVASWVLSIAITIGPVAPGFSLGGYATERACLAEGARLLQRYRAAGGERVVTLRCDPSDKPPIR